MWQTRNLCKVKSYQNYFSSLIRFLWRNCWQGCCHFWKFERCCQLRWNCDRIQSDFEKGRSFSRFVHESFVHQSRRIFQRCSSCCSSVGQSTGWYKSFCFSKFLAHDFSSLFLLMAREEWSLTLHRLLHLMVKSDRFKIKKKRTRGWFYACVCVCVFFFMFQKGCLCCLESRCCWNDASFGKVLFLYFNFVCSKLPLWKQRVCFPRHQSLHHCTRFVFHFSTFFFLTIVIERNIWHPNACWLAWTCACAVGCIGSFSQASGKADRGLLRMMTL